MSKPFDVTTKNLVEAHPEDWVALLGLPPGPVKVITPELSTVVAEADRVLRVEAPKPYLLHIELQPSQDKDLAARLFRYNALLYFAYRVPVVSVAVLLRRQADDPSLTGEWTASDEAGAPYLSFRYRVLRVWEQSPETFLRGGLGTLPLAPLGKTNRARLPAVIRAMEEQADGENLSETETATLWMSTFILLGLKYPRDFALQLMRGVQQMRESTTYQWILEQGEERGRKTGQEEGRKAEARRFLRMIGDKRFGTPDAAAVAAVEAADVEQLETWAELLGTSDKNKQ